MIMNSLSDMASHFNKTRNAVMYQIKLGRLPDPRNSGVDSSTITWPEGEKVGRKPGNKNKISIRSLLVELIARVETLENKIKSLDSTAGDHG
jgi:hypothetical protein